MSIIPQEIIIKKRDGQSLTVEEISGFIAGLTNGQVSDPQAAAFAMATLLKGMSLAERTALTESMRDSGKVLRWDLPGPVADKHSTGGIGDKVSLMLGPIAAACGLFIPMIAGRGLGHTGGTVDKFESIPGYNTAPDDRVFEHVVRNVGVAIIGQTADLAPADGRLYGIRDVTGTVESIDLITSSILSKKLAAGLESLVMDIKVGSGAFMKTTEEAYALARSIVGVANRAGCKTAAVLTRMDQVLGHTAGNALEVSEAIAFLAGEIQETALKTVTLTLVGQMLVNADIVQSQAAGIALAETKLDDGSAMELFWKMCAGLGAETGFDRNSDAMMGVGSAPIIRPVLSARAGHVSSIHARDFGIAVVELGGGRKLPGAAVNHRVGITEAVRVGQPIAIGQPLCMVHAETEAALELAASTITAAVTIGEERAQGPLIIDTLTEAEAS